MNKRISVGYIGVLTLMLLFPPTVVVTKSIKLGGGYESSEESGGFRFIGSLGQVEKDSSSLAGLFTPNTSISMDGKQFGLQIFVVTLMAVAGCVAFAKKSVGRSKQEE